MNRRTAELFFIMSKLRAVLKEPNFFLLWLGQLISQFGDKFTQMALVGLVYKKAPGSTLELAKLFIFVIVPVFIVGPLAGAYSDRWSRKYTMIVSDAIRGGLVLLIVLYWAFVPTLQPIFPIYIIVFIIFSVTRFYVPSKMSIIPDMVDPDKLLEANSLIHTTGMVAAALGFGIGGIIISLPSIGVKGGLLIDAATFFVSALLLIFIRVRKREPKITEAISVLGKRLKEVMAKSVFGEIKDGLMYLFSHRKMHFVIALLFLLWSGVGASHVVIIVFIQQALASITRDLGLLIMFFSIGLFCGSIVYGKFGQRLSKARAIFLSLILGGFLLIGFVVILNMHANFHSASMITFLFGCSLSPIMISSNTIVHELIPAELRGRVFSSLEAVMHLAYLIFMVASAMLAEVINNFYILLAIGIIFICSGIFGIKKIPSARSYS
ncbi:MAG: MFS transporter [Candidatus Omnitrophota bacterium]